MKKADGAVVLVDCMEEVEEKRRKREVKGKRRRGKCECEARGKPLKATPSRVGWWIEGKNQLRLARRGELTHL